MSGPGSCVRLSWRAWLLVAPAAVLLIGLAAWLPLARPASAQTQLTLADFDDAGVDVEFAALLEVAQDTSGGWTLLYQGPPRTPAAGTLVDGDRNVGTDDVAITRVRQNDTDGDLQLADSDTTFHIGDYFATGAGSDLDLYLQDDTTALAEVAFTLDGASNGSIRLGLPADAQTLLQGLSDGDRLIVAFARPAPDPPAQVMGVAATADDYDSITVSWTAVTDADGYVVEWDDDSAFASSAEATVSSGSTVTYQITGLTENTTHYVRVYATRTDTADGAVSDVASATTELQPPAQVTGLTATAASSTSIDVAWDAASLADGYTVEWGTTSGSYTDDDTTASTSHAITGLSASTTHYLRVTATRTGADDGTPSAERSAATEPGTLPPPAQVTGVSASADDHDSITVSWNAVTSTCGSNSPYYEVRWDDDSGFASPQDEEFIPDTTDRYQITGLQEGTPYFVQVRGVCTDLFGFYTAEGAWSAADSATTELQPPERVTGVIADATSDVEIMVSWVMAIRAGGYVVQWREDDFRGLTRTARRP